MDYPPVPMTRVALAPSERHLHSFKIRGSLYGVAAAGPTPLEFIGHFTNRRFVLEPMQTNPSDWSDPVEVNWNDLIEFAAVGTEGSAADLPGAEEHMLHAVTKSGPLLAIDAWMLFTAEPTTGARAPERPMHTARFAEIADELLVDAFESDGS